ncbi:DUF2927 domain-containing protein [Thioclava sp. GXIMD4216]|uniref:DUF2927 domain-containing protein n=1 Tax=Thioclava sp. GXIMD4216 TaxID=3131929 RepID=UPI0030CDAA85
MTGGASETFRRGALSRLPHPLGAVVSSRHSRMLRAMGVGLCLLAVAGCSTLPFSGPAAQGPRKTPRPQTAPQDLNGAKVAPRSPDSIALAAYFQQVQDNLLSQGLMRTDVAPRDAPFHRRQLIDNFVNIALYDEYEHRNGAFVAKQTASKLRRWEEPVRMDLHFGASIPEAQRQKDTATVRAYAGKLAQITRHPISLVPDRGNFSVLVLNEDEREGSAALLRKMVPGIDDSSVNAITNLPTTTFCVVFAFSEGDKSAYSRAVAIIRGEHPDALRESCFDEELAQGLGLANDYPRARPSIFNDDEEFARLTHQDELMLKMLYDPRLRPGMTQDEAMPAIREIAAELTPND